MHLSFVYFVKAVKDKAVRKHKKMLIMHSYPIQNNPLELSLIQNYKNMIFKCS